ncbi:10808_t:CDS:2, partial [Funneliformis geosporum]
NDVAQYDLAKRYQNGWGIEKNSEKAFDCIEIKEDLKKALFWYQKSAVNKNKEAQYNIIKCYINGIGINKDLEKAYKWHQRLVKNENRSKRSFGKYETNHQNINENIITDFGISKIGNNSTRHIGLCGKTAYIDPQILINHNFQYIKPSDIYSFGILMWEISSGYPPFKDLNDTTIYAAIINNNARETTISDTPQDYEKLYKKCWDQEPKQRPTITELLVEFSRMNFMNKKIKDKFNNNQDLIIAITCHKTREISIADTPEDYEKLYKKCWKQEPKQRPIIKEVLKIFYKMGFGKIIGDDETTKDTENNNSDPDSKIGDSIQLDTFENLSITNYEV